MSRVAIRWTIGDVSSRGFDALALSIRSLTALLPGAEFVVTVNSIPLPEARRRIGSVAGLVDWHASDSHAAEWLRNHVDRNFAEGVAWKLAPVRLFPNRFELSLDNDIVLWDLPPSIETWLNDPESCLIAEDVAPAFGQFSAICGPAPRNSGIRGLPPGFDMELGLRGMLKRHPVVMHSELDEQGLQVAVINEVKHHVVTLGEVTICSPFPPHVRSLGRSGAHFVGLNSDALQSGGERWVRANWDGWLPAITERVQAASANTSLV